MAAAVFDQLHSISVPHILEMIFFSLDYDSYKTCLEVSTTWRQLLTSEPFQRMAKLRFREGIERDGSLLYHVSFAGDARQVRRFVSLGFIDIDSPNLQMAREYGWSPLHHAARFGRGRAVKVLLENGADPDKTDVKGSTPLHVAAHGGVDDYLSVGKMLLERGADPRKENDFGRTPMSVAAKYRHREMLALLRGLRPRRRRDVA